MLNRKNKLCTRDEILIKTKHFYMEKLGHRLYNLKCEEIRRTVENYNGPIRYYTFYINKDNPNERTFKPEEAEKWTRVRTINAPVSDLKEPLVRICKILNDFTLNLEHVKGFNKWEGVVNNALVHKRAEEVVNFDLKDYFPQFNSSEMARAYERVFNLKKSTARKLAKMSTLKGKLVQGSPLSPIMTNILSTHLDMRLKGFCKKAKLNYSRYADDITISTNNGRIKGNVIRYLINKIISDEGFIVNPQKTTRFRNVAVVTGVVLDINQMQQSAIKYWGRKKKIRNKLRWVKHMEKLGIWHTRRLNKEGNFNCVWMVKEGLLGWINVRPAKPKDSAGNLLQRRYYRMNARAFRKLAKYRKFTKLKETQVLSSYYMMKGNRSVLKMSNKLNSDQGVIAERNKVNWECKWLGCELRDTVKCLSCHYFLTESADAKTFRALCKGNKVRENVEQCHN